MLTVSNSALVDGPFCCVASIKHLQFSVGENKRTGIQLEGLLIHCHKRLFQIRFYHSFRASIMNHFLLQPTMALVGILGTLQAQDNSNQILKETPQPKSQIGSNGQRALPPRKLPGSLRGSSSPLIRGVYELMDAGKLDVAARTIDEIADDVGKESIATLRIDLAEKHQQKRQTKEAKEQASKALEYLLPKFEQLLSVGELDKAHQVGTLLQKPFFQSGNRTEYANRAFQALEKHLPNDKFSPLHSTRSQMLSIMTFQYTSLGTRDAGDQQKTNVLWETEMALAESFLAANPDDHEIAKHAISVFFRVLHSSVEPRVGLANNEIVDRIFAVTRSDFQAHRNCDNLSLLLTWFVNPMVPNLVPGTGLGVGSGSLPGNYGDQDELYTRTKELCEECKAISLDNDSPSVRTIVYRIIDQHLLSASTRLASQHLTMGRLLLTKKEISEGVPHFRRAAELYDSMVQKDAIEITTSLGFASVISSYRSATSRTDGVWLPSPLVQLHCSAVCHAILAGVAGKENSGVTTEEGETNAFTAVDSLRRALATTIPPERLSTSKDDLTKLMRDIENNKWFDPLRDREDFKQLLSSF